MFSWEWFSFKQELNERKPTAHTTEVRLGNQLNVLPPGFRMYKTCLLFIMLIITQNQTVSKKKLSTLFLLLHIQEVTEERQLK